MARRSPAAHARRNNALLQSLHEDYLRLFAGGDYTGALAVIRKARKISAAPDIVQSEALCLMRLGKFQLAYALAKPLSSNAFGNSNINYLDLMAELCGHLERRDEVRAYGSLSLQRKDEEVAEAPRRPLPVGAPPRFAAANRAANVIAYTLFGERPRYCEGAILNCQAAAHLFPEWTCRFYCDATAPEAVRRRLVEAGGEIVQVDEGLRERVHPLMWRFLVAADPAVARFLVRDADSLLGEREQEAVRAWTASDRWFHVIRDWHTHTELMLAGLWGGCGGVFPDMEAEIVAFLRAGDFAASHVDQYFLRRRIWPTVRQSVLSHDSLFDFFNNQPFPSGGDPDSALLHVGANMGSSLIVGEMDVPDGTMVQWALRDDAGRDVCSYRTAVVGKQWKDYIPVDYAQKIKVGGWAVTAERI